MLSIDPTCPKEEMAMFETLINEIALMAKIDDSANSNLVDTLMKVEQKLMNLCEARNYLVMKDNLTKPTERETDKTIEEFEKYFIK